MQVVRNNLGLDEGQKVLEIVKAVDAAFGDEDVAGLLIGDGADEAAVGCNNRLIRRRCVRARD